MNVAQAIHAVRAQNSGQALSYEELVQGVLAWYETNKGYSLNPHLLGGDVQRYLEQEQRSTMGATPEDTKFYYPRDSSRFR